MDYAVGLLFGEFEEGVENDAGAEGEADEGYWADAEVTLDEDVCKDATGGFGTVECVVPWIVDQVSEFR